MRFMIYNGGKMKEEIMKEEMYNSIKSKVLDNFSSFYIGISRDVSFNVMLAIRTPEYIKWDTIDNAFKDLWSH